METIISISGNSAKYRKNTEATLRNEKFQSLTNVDILDNGTISLYHYGKLGKKQFDELRRLGSYLQSREILLAFGFDYTKNQPILIVIGCKGISVIPFQLKISPKYSCHKIRMLDWLSNHIPIDFQYNNSQIVAEQWRDSLRKNKTDFFINQSLNPSEEMEGDSKTLKQGRQS